MARRLALLIGNSQFEDEEHFPPLRTPANDVADMAAMLAQHGDFEIVDVLIDAAEPVIRRTIGEFYGQLERGDLALLYYSGHGYKGMDGSLYLTAKDTDASQLRATGVRESFIQETMGDSRSRHHVVILDCCFSGAFALGKKGGAGEPLLLEKLRGEATAILASSGTIQYSFEEEGRNSLFTGALLAGVETGAADEDQNGVMTIDELFSYVDRMVREQRREQTPMLAQQKREIEQIVLARNPARPVSPLPLTETTSTPAPPSPEPQRKGVLSTAPGWAWGIAGLLAVLMLAFPVWWVLGSSRGDDQPTPTLPAVTQATEIAAEAEPSTISESGSGTSSSRPLPISSHEPLDLPVIKSKLAAQGNELSLIKFGFHVLPGGNSSDLEEWVTALDEAGIPFFLKSVDDVGSLAMAQSLAQASGISHTLVFRASIQGYDVPNYDLSPADSARQHWVAHTAAFPASLAPRLVWLETINEPDPDRAGWLGEFALETAQLALADGYRWAAFGWSSGTPDPADWESPAMIQFLQLAGQYPDQLAVAVHEYSFGIDDRVQVYSTLLGRFTALFQVCDRNELPRPTILITEWGWEFQGTPPLSQAMEDIALVSWWYAPYPEVRGAAIWTLGAFMGERDDQTRQLIAPLTDYTLHNYFMLSK